MSRAGRRQKFALSIVLLSMVGATLLASAQSASVLQTTGSSTSNAYDETVQNASNGQIRIVTGFDYSPDYIAVTHVSGNNFKLTFPDDGTRVGGWYMFKVEGAAGKTVSVTMTNVPGKWRTHHPVYSYSKDLGSLKSFISKKPRTTHQAQTPESELSPKGKRKGRRQGPVIPDTSLEKWHYIADVTRSNRCLIVTHTFTEDHAYVAMRVP